MTRGPQFVPPQWPLKNFLDYGPRVIELALARGWTLESQLCSGELEFIVNAVLQEKLAPPPPQYPKLLHVGDGRGGLRHRSVTNAEEEAQARADGYTDEGPDGTLLALELEAIKMAEEAAAAEKQAALAAQRRAEVQGRLAALQGSKK